MATSGIVNLPQNFTKAIDKFTQPTIIGTESNDYSFDQLTPNITYLYKLSSENDTK